MKCGRCGRNEYGILKPYIVRSRGETYESYAHEDCARKWANISDIRPDPSRKDVVLADMETEFARSVRTSKPMRYREIYLRRRMNSTQKCATCGVSISQAAVHCREHAAVLREKIKKENGTSNKNLRWMSYWRVKTNKQ